jgi:Flp pilus assembly protein TadD
MSLAQASTAAGKGDWTRSAKDARRAHTWAPWSSEPYRLLGEAELGQGDTKAAIASFNKAIANNPTDWNLWFDLARATTGNAQRDALRHAKQLNPLSPEIAELQKEINAEKVINVVPKSPAQPGTP